ncbi:hypothetical protein L204_104811 [Cryptococcus depauperatus]
MGDHGPAIQQEASELGQTVTRIANESQLRQRTRLQPLASRFKMEARLLRSWSETSSLITVGTVEDNVRSVEEVYGKKCAEFGPFPTDSSQQCFKSDTQQVSST